MLSASFISSSCAAFGYTTCTTPPPVMPSCRARTCPWLAGCSGIGGTVRRRATPTLPTSHLVEAVERVGECHCSDNGGQHRYLRVGTARYGLSGYAGLVYLILVIVVGLTRAVAQRGLAHRFLDHIAEVRFSGSVEGIEIIGA